MLRGQSERTALDDERSGNSRAGGIGAHKS